MIFFFISLSKFFFIKLSEILISFFGKMLDAYDAFLPQADVANLFGMAAERLEKAAEALKEFQQAGNKKNNEEGDKEWF